MFNHYLATFVDQAVVFQVCIVNGSPAASEVMTPADGSEFTKNASILKYLCQCKPRGEIGWILGFGERLVRLELTDR